MNAADSAPAHSPYGLTHPTAADLHASITGLRRSGAAEAWQRLLETAGVTTADSAPAHAARLIETACASDDPTVAMCGLAQRIRLVAFQRLSQAQELVATAAGR